ncbi:hypothetical protein XELAEV_18038224mg [Xenopus laevis]|uniref:Uncharacterized protein n=1 Tax=Xenopus laevis TaxID=8355 RepID=A0A974C5R5_XENLA|nr:hypothetical protein XELAEV_18038224mg [Xenopus laevis]
MDKTPPQSLKSDPPTSTLSPPSPGSCFINTMDGRLQRWFPLATLKYDGQRYLCHGRGGDSSSSPQIVHVTNGAEVWGADVTEETLDEWGQEEMRNVIGPLDWTLDYKLNMTRTNENLIRTFDSEGAPTSASPVKVSQTPQSLLFQDLDSRKKGYGTSAPQLKKRIPGESLINPGSKSKKAARGVDFDDA